MNRRDLLKSMGAAAGAASLSKILPGCSASGPGKVDTFIYLMMENRSYDHWLGARGMTEGRPGDGLDPTTMFNNDSEGNPIAPWEATIDTMCVPDPSHGWDASHIQFNGGRNDGFVTTDQMEHPGDLGAMQYVTRAHIPVTWALADEYATCDRWFASVMGSTWPNRFFWLSGTSMGEQGNSVPDGGYTAPTIFQRLSEAGVDWAIYYVDLPFAAVLGTGFTSHVDVDGRMRRFEDFQAEAAAGTLPSVCFLDPPFTIADDHPPHHPISGQQYIASVYNALATSPQWERCLWVTTYDEHGGFFDHVPPPKTVDDNASLGFDQLGFRVPTMVVGPYVKQGHVSRVVRDHTSALRHLQNVFGLDGLGMRCDAATDLSELYDEERLASGKPAEPITLPEVNPDDWVIGAECKMSTLVTVGGESTDDLQRWFDVHPEMRHLDRRDELPASMDAIAKGATCR